MICDISRDPIALQTIIELVTLCIAPGLVLTATISARRKYCMYLSGRYPRQNQLYALRAMSRRLRRAAFPYAAGNLANQIDIVDLSQERHQDLQQFICYRPIRKQDIRRDRWLEESVSVYGATILTIIVGLWILMVAKALPKLYMANDLLLQIFATVGLIAALVVTIIVIIPLIHVSNHVCRSDYRARRMVIANLPNIPSKHQYKVLNRKWYLYFALNLGFFIFSVFLASFVTPVFRFSPYN